MHDSHGHDHTQATHSAKCDVVGCEFVAKVHAHDDDEAVELLSIVLAQHNKDEHKSETNVEEILAPVREKMQRIQND